MWKSPVNHDPQTRVRVDPALRFAPNLTGEILGRRILTVNEVACELRCSKAHVHHLINGQVNGVCPLPSLRLGRRRLVLKASFEEWLRTSERHRG